MLVQDTALPPIERSPKPASQRCFFSVLETENTCVFINAFGFCFGDLPGGSDGKESACNAGDPGSIPGLGRSPGEGIGYPLQCSCLGNPVDRGAWRATVHRVKKRSARLCDSENFTLHTKVLRSLLQITKLK